jgi:SAM-dependent methyltransferase
MTQSAYIDLVHDLVGGDPATMGPWQLDLLQRFGLRPHHQILDIGCGTLRGGLHLIQYLDVGHYTGIDPLPELIDAGRRLCVTAALDDKEPRLGDLDLLCLETPNNVPRFDYILTQSVLNHIDAETVLQVIDVVDKTLAPSGIWVGSALFCAADSPSFSSPHPRRPREWTRVTHSLPMIQGDLQRRGLCLALHPEILHPRQLEVFSVRRPLDPK